jgi:tRNA threonylcarbamoyladenosine biosynthesis protein TsaB
MLILSIDTSGKSGGVTLAQGDAASFKVIASAPIAGGTFSAQLVPTVAALLDRHGFAVKDLNGFAVASGPGSFTGLRIGLSAIKGLAEILRKPIATVSLLEALASSRNPDSPTPGSANRSGEVAAILDASRGEFFLGVYQLSDDRSSKALREALCSKTELLDELQSQRPQQIITCDEVVSKMLTALHIAHEMVARPDSATVARLGLRKLLAGETVAAESLDANYLRRSDAEVVLKGGQP